MVAWSQANSYLSIVGLWKGKPVTNFTYSKDLPDNLDLGKIVAVDCESMGLHPGRDRLCVVQL